MQFLPAFQLLLLGLYLGGPLAHISLWVILMPFWLPLVFFAVAGSLVLFAASVVSRKSGRSFDSVLGSWTFRINRGGR